MPIQQPQKTGQTQEIDQQRKPDGQLGRPKGLSVGGLPLVEQFLSFLLDPFNDRTNILHGNLPPIGLHLFEGSLGAILSLIVQRDRLVQLRQLGMDQIFEFGQALGLIWIVGRQPRDFVDPGFITLQREFVGGQIALLPREQIAALSRLGVGHRLQQLFERLLDFQGVDHPLRLIVKLADLAITNRGIGRHQGRQQSDPDRQNISSGLLHAADSTPPHSSGLLAFVSIVAIGNPLRQSSDWMRAASTGEKISALSAGKLSRPKALPVRRATARQRKQSAATGSIGAIERRPSQPNVGSRLNGPRLFAGQAGQRVFHSPVIVADVDPSGLLGIETEMLSRPGA